MAARGKKGDRPATSGHNGIEGPEQQERRRAFLVHMDALRRAREATDLAKESLKAVRKRETTARNAAKGDGFPLAVIDRILEDESKSRVDLEIAAEMERWLRTAVGLPVGGQIDLFSEDVAPRDADWWFADGKQAALSNRPAEAPAGCPPELMQDWLRGHMAGQEDIAWAMSEKANVNPEKKPGADIAVSLDPEPTDDVCPVCHDGESIPDEAGDSWTCPGCGAEWETDDPNTPPAPVAEEPLDLVEPS